MIISSFIPRRSHLKSLITLTTRPREIRPPPNTQTKKKWITYPTQLCLVLISFCTSLLHPLIIILFTLLKVFHISVSWWFSSRVRVTTSLLKSPGLFLVLWPISTIVSTHPLIFMFFSPCINPIYVAVIYLKRYNSVQKDLLRHQISQQELTLRETNQPTNHKNTWKIPHRPYSSRVLLFDYHLLSLAYCFKSFILSRTNKKQWLQLKKNK